VVTPLRGATCFSLSGFVGVGRGVGDGCGLAAGGWVTKVIVCAAGSCWLAAVFAPGPIVTWYWVFGARFPLTGVTDS